ncbi:type I polyketide synthase [Paenibacillus sp. FJAT-26967]|uniref:type I polyketide synthase n=1 Tax=Paenibacillus sp. FJAT-26967 TaxID=1729690 RepID=UPI000838190F|nr:SDR family NAD(P)-dependent oxidoreductase [Paenibacillus sp. FJAT-26967]
MKLADILIEDVMDEESIEEIQDKDIAVIGIALQFPDAASPAEFWNNLINGVDSIKPIPQRRKKDVDHLRNTIKKDLKGEYQEAGYLEEIDAFDYSFFNISPKEASLMDPVHRKFLEIVWSAVEDAGYSTRFLAGENVGMYVGVSPDADYKSVIAQLEPDHLFMSLPGNLRPMVGSRPSHMLDWRGPNMVIDTTCSSSLVAVHTACQAIRSGECEMAIAGGAQVHLFPVRDFNVGIESSNNRTRAFDDGSDGTGTGEGVAAVLLKSLGQARKAGDHIYAVIKGSAVNHDGASIGITAPNPVAQEAVLVQAWKNANIAPETLSYIEVHGTGTKLGDPVEIDGINRAFSRYTSKKQFCAIGTVKSNIGHLDQAAGIAGFIKAVLALHHKKLPPSLHFVRPNRKINFEDTAIYINDQPVNWTGAQAPSRCGVSSFGITGTNCHIVLEEAALLEEPRAHRSSLTEEVHAFTISAKSADSLKRLVERYKLALIEYDYDLKDFCYTLNTGRDHHDYRVGVVLAGEQLNKQALITVLNKILSTESEALGTQDSFFYGVRRSRPGNDENSAQNTDRLTEQFIAGNYREESVLSQLLCLYTQGADLNWPLIYGARRYRRVSLPAYPFTPSRCWISDPSVSKGQEETAEAAFYRKEWNRQPLTEQAKPHSRPVLLIDNGTAKGEEIARSYKEEGIVVVEARIEDLNDDSLERILTANRIDQVVYVQHNGVNRVMDSEQELDRNLRNGFYRLFGLMKGIDRFDKTGIDLFLVTDCAHKVTDEDSLVIPENAMAVGLGLTYALEHRASACRMIDIDELTDARVLVKEMLSSSKDKIVAFRNNARYTEVLVPVMEASQSDNRYPIRDNGVYVLTGGLGVIGRQIAKSLAADHKVNLVLLGRTELPERHEWEAIVQDSQEHPNFRQIFDLLELEKTGASVFYYSVDVTDERQMMPTMNAVRERFGRIHGVVHCAGVGSRMKGALIRDEDLSVVQQVLSPKVKGTWILDRSTRQDTLDFFVLCSSAITLIGGAGSGHYTAANCFLNAYASRRRLDGANMTSINWSAWQEGLSEREQTGMRSSQLFELLGSDEATQAFYRALHLPCAQVIVGRIHTESAVWNMEEWLPFGLSEEIKDALAKRSSEGEFNKLPESAVISPGKQITSYGEITRYIASAWKDVLGYEQIKETDNFFEIGGDSIMITSIQRKLEQVFPGVVTLGDLFSFPSIASLAEYIHGRIHPSEPNDPIVERDYAPPASGMQITEMLKQLKEGKLTVDHAMKNYRSLGDLK